MKLDRLQQIKDKPNGGDTAWLIWEVTCLRRRVWDWRGIAAASAVLFFIFGWLVGMVTGWPMR
jgi:hypothetical protein